MQPTGDLTLMLGRPLLEGVALELCRQYGLTARAGARFYESRERGVEVAVDDQNRVATVTLHFRDDAGFHPFRGMIPGRGGTIAKRMSLWAALGRPLRSTDTPRGPADEWAFPTFVMRARYDTGGERLERIVLER